MYCRNCGKQIEDSTLYCNHCGAPVNGVHVQVQPQPQTVSDDKSSFWLALVCFFIPILGLILFLVYESKSPKRAKSAGKGALAGVITKFVLSIVLVILYFAFAASMVSSVAGGFEPFFNMITETMEEDLKEETTDEILDEYIDVTFGEYKLTKNEYHTEAVLEVTLKNKAPRQCTYYVTIEAIDQTGARLDTDTVSVNQLGSMQEIHLTAFKTFDEGKIAQLQNANFRVLEVRKYTH